MMNTIVPSQMPVNAQTPGTPGANNAALQLTPQTSQNVQSFGQSVSPGMSSYMQQMAGPQTGSFGQFAPNSMAAQIQALLGMPQGSQPPAQQQTPMPQSPQQQLPGSSPVVPNSPFAQITPGPFSLPIGGSSSGGTGGNNNALSLPVPGAPSGGNNSGSMGNPAPSSGGFQLSLPANLTSNFSSPANPPPNFVSPAQQAAQAAQAAAASGTTPNQFTGTGTKQQDLNLNTFGIYGVQNGLYYPLGGLSSNGWTGPAANPTSAPVNNNPSLSQFGPASTFYNGSNIYSGPVYATGNNGITTLRA